MKQIEGTMIHIVGRGPILVCKAYEGEYHLGQHIMFDHKQYIIKGIEGTRPHKGTYGLLVKEI